ncbi:MAG: ABC transporter ATP-binding protein [Bacillota bacterium]
MPSRDNSLMAARHVSKRFRIRRGLSATDLVAVNEVSLDIGYGGPEILALVGESGSGKSTFAYSILGLVEPTTGSIMYKGQDVAKVIRTASRMWFRKEVQPVFQNPFDTFNPLRKVESYLYETVFNYGVAEKAADAEKVIEEALEAVGLSWGDVLGKYPHELSGGQLQRCSVARALLTGPSLIVADEPVSMIDASLRMSIVNLFKNLKEERGITVLYITHDLSTAYYVSDRVAVMLRGTLVEAGATEEIFSKPLHPYTRVLLESVPAPDPNRRWAGEVKLPTLELKEFARQGCKFIDRCPYVHRICYSQKPETRLIGGRYVMCHFAEDIERKQRGAAAPLMEVKSPRTKG